MTSFAVKSYLQWGMNNYNWKIGWNKSFSQDFVVVKFCKYPSKHTASFWCLFNVQNVRTTLHGCQNNVVCVLGITNTFLSFPFCEIPSLLYVTPHFTRVVIIVCVYTIPFLNVHILRMTQRRSSHIMSLTFLRIEVYIIMICTESLSHVRQIFSSYNQIPLSR